jgi:hypothetical protein
MRIDQIPSGSYLRLSRGGGGAGGGYGAFIHAGLGGVDAVAAGGGAGSVVAEGTAVGAAVVVGGGEGAIAVVGSVVVGGGAVVSAVVAGGGTDDPLAVDPGTEVDPWLVGFMSARAQTSTASTRKTGSRMRATSRRWLRGGGARS